MKRYVALADQMKIRPLERRDRTWIERTVLAEFGSSRVVSRGVLHDLNELPALVAEDGIDLIGFLQFNISSGQCEVVVLMTVRRREGVGRELVEALRIRAQVSRCSRIWLITTNDNSIAQDFYRAVGFRKVAVHTDAIAESRKLKPEIPEYAQNGIAIKDEIEYEWSPINGAEKT